MSRYTFILFCLALVATLCAVIVCRDVYVHTRGVLRVAFLDVGQGDSIYVESPTGTQVLVDGGATRKVLREIRKVMPLFDSSLNLVVATHPDADHVGGLVDVLERYRVERLVYQEVADHAEGPADAFEQALIRERLENTSTHSLTEQDAFVAEPHRGDVWDIGGGAYIVLHYPDKGGNRDDTNAGSVVARVVYGDTAFMLTGDAPSEVEGYLVGKDGGDHTSQLRADVLKVGHHGSRTSSSPLFLAAVSPTWAVVSRGCDNTYGHPHKEVLGVFEKMNVRVLDTCTEGTVVFESDGSSVSLVQ